VDGWSEPVLKVELEAEVTLRCGGAVERDEYVDIAGRCCGVPGHGPEKRQVPDPETFRKQGFVGMQQLDGLISVHEFTSAGGRPRGFVVIRIYIKCRFAWFCTMLPYRCTSYNAALPTASRRRLATARSGFFDSPVKYDNITDTIG